MSRPSDYPEMMKALASRVRALRDAVVPPKAELLDPDYDCAHCQDTRLLITIRADGVRFAERCQFCRKRFDETLAGQGRLDREIAGEDDPPPPLY